MQQILLISDIGFQIEHFLNLFEKNGCKSFARIDVYCSPGSENELSNLNIKVTALDMKAKAAEVSEKYDLIISYHCRQLFPKEVIRKVRCINIHPGFNPYNRGWYPGVFSIANGLPAGATIHEIDEKIDNGPIIAQKQIEIRPEDTSGTVYPKIIQAEYDLLEQWFLKIITGDCETFLPKEKGNLNNKKDYYALQKLDLDERLTMRECIDKLRALTHPPYLNAYFIDPETGDKLFISVNLKREKK